MAIVRTTAVEKRFLRTQSRTPARGRTSVHEVDAFPHEMVESVKPLLPGRPVELIGPVRHDVLQPIQGCALFPTYSGHLIGPSRMA